MLNVCPSQLYCILIVLPQIQSWYHHIVSHFE